MSVELSPDEKIELNSTSSTTGNTIPNTTARELRIGRDERIARLAQQDPQVTHRSPHRRARVIADQLEEDVLEVGSTDLEMLQD